MKSAPHRLRRAKLLLALPAVAAPVASADIVYTSINGGAGLTFGPTGTLYFDPVVGTATVDTYATGSFQLFFYAQEPHKPTIASFYATNAAMTDKLAAGVLVDSSGSFTQGVAALAQGGPWDGGGSGYLGLRPTVAGQSHYGWANITYDTGGTITLFEMAYETTPNQGIVTGAVPEPAETAALVALAAGSAAAFAARRKRRLAAAK